MNSLKLLEKIVKQNSFSTNKDGVNKVGEILANELSFMNLRRIKGNTYGDIFIFSSPNSTNKPNILLCGHIDTVHAPEIDIPYVISGNKIYGPGTQDMKGGIIAIVEVLKKLHKQGNLDNISFIAVPNEEVRWEEHLDALKKQYNRFDYAMVYEPTSQKPDKGKYNKNKRTIVTSRKGGATCRFDINAAGGHSGVLSNRDQRKSAIEDAGKLILEIEALADYDKGTTTNVGRIIGGTVFNALAESCTLEVEFRVKTRSEYRRLINGFKKLAKNPYIDGIKRELTIISSSYPMVPNSNTKKLISTAMAAAEKLGIDLEEEARGGGSDAATIAELGVAVIDGMGVEGDGEHTKNEFIYADSINGSIDLSIELINMLQYLK